MTRTHQSFHPVSHPLICPLNHVWIHCLQREESSQTHTDTLTPETRLPCRSRAVGHWAVLPEVQCLARGHFSRSRRHCCCCCCDCGTEMCFSFSSLTESLSFFSTSCPGMVTCDHLVTNSEPLGYSCPHDARLVLSGTMLHQILKSFQLHTDSVVFFSWYAEKKLCTFWNIGVNFNGVPTQIRKVRESVKRSKTFHPVCVFVKTKTENPDEWGSCRFSLIWYLNLWNFFWKTSPVIKCYLHNWLF